MTQEESAPGARPESKTREYHVTGLSDLLPDWILPAEGKQHVRNARKEMLLAFRSVIDRAIEFQEKGAKVRHTPSKIEIE